jgi:hypothetical protein
MWFDANGPWHSQVHRVVILTRLPCKRHGVKAVFGDGQMGYNVLVEKVNKGEIMLVYF